MLALKKVAMSLMIVLLFIVGSTVLIGAAFICVWTFDQGEWEQGRIAGSMLFSLVIVYILYTIYELVQIWRYSEKAEGEEKEEA